MKKILTSIIGGLILFVWNAFSWMGLPFHGDMLKTIPESSIQQILTSSLPDGTGIYHYPDLNDPNLAEKIESGPRIPFLAYVDEGTSLFDPGTFVKSLGFNLLSAFLLLMLLLKLTNSSLTDVIKISTLCGLLVGFSSDFPQTVWYMFPNDYAIVNTIDHIIGFSLAGLAMSKLKLKKIN